jgi:hypothetical protein
MNKIIILLFWSKFTVLAKISKAKLAMLLTKKFYLLLCKKKTIVILYFALHNMLMNLIWQIN